MLRGCRHARRGGHASDEIDSATANVRSTNPAPPAQVAAVLGAAPAGHNYFAGRAADLIVAARLELLAGLVLVQPEHITHGEGSPFNLSA